MSQKERRREEKKNHRTSFNTKNWLRVNGVVVFYRTHGTHKPPVAFLMLQNITIIYSLFLPYTHAPSKLLQSSCRVCVLVFVFVHDGTCACVYRQHREESKKKNKNDRNIVYLASIQTHGRKRHLEPFMHLLH